MSQNFSIPNDGSTLWQRMSREGKGFTALTGFITIAGTSETNLMLMRNPADSGKLVRLKDFIMTIGGSATQRTLFRFYRAPTITNAGGALDINKVLPIGVPTSSVLAYQSPVTSASGALIQMFSVNYFSFARDQDLGRYLVAGADLLITVQSSANNVEHNLLSVWAEEDV